MDFDQVLNHLRQLHEGHDDLLAFCPFPTDVVAQPVHGPPYGRAGSF